MYDKVPLHGLLNKLQHSRGDKETIGLLDLLGL